MMWSYLIVAALVLFAGTAAWAQDSAAFRPGEGVQRTMRLLAESTPEQPNEVRILFYGQSITNGSWTGMVAEDLRKRFPHTDLVIENRSIGGFSVPRLSRPAEHDVYPFYPDLVIFHVYGSEPAYEELIREIRTRTTAEVLLQADHVTKLPTPQEEGAEPGMEWHRRHNEVWLPDLARRLGTGFVDNWTSWLEHLETNDLEPKALLSDNVHLNEEGNRLMAQLVSAYLVRDPSLPAEQTVETVEVTADDWVDERLVREFVGNRVDVILGGGAEGEIEVLVDGKRPSEVVGTVSFTRPTPSVWAGWPVVYRVDWKTPPVVEEWTLRLEEVDNERRRFRFSVEGSETGADGEGWSDERFESDSGRVVISPEDWWIDDPRIRTGPADQPELKVGKEIKWQAVAMYMDRIEATAGRVTVVQGIPPGRHQLELKADQEAAEGVKAIRIYRPPLPEVAEAD